MSSEHSVVLDLPVDHVGIAIVAPKIDEVCKAFRGLGFQVTTPKPLMGVDADGRPVPLGQESAHIVFANGYIELTAVRDPAGHHLENVVGADKGFHILALRASDADAVHAALQQTELRPGAVQEARREITYGKGGEARFKWFAFADGILPGLLAGVVEHLTPELVFQPTVMAQANGVLALEEVIVAVPDVEKAAQALAPLDGLGVSSEQVCRKLTLTDAAASHGGLGIAVTVQELYNLESRLEERNLSIDRTDPSELRVRLAQLPNLDILFRGEW